MNSKHPDLIEVGVLESLYGQVVKLFLADFASESHQEAGKRNTDKS